MTSDFGFKNSLKLVVVYGRPLRKMGTVIRGIRGIVGIVFKRNFF